MGSVVIYNYLTCRKRSDTVNHKIREIDEQDKGIVFTITVSVKLPSGIWNKDPITTTSKTNGMNDINNGKVDASYSGGKYKYYVKAYANQALELSGIPDGSKVTCSAPKNIYADATQTVTSSVIALSAFNESNGKEFTVSSAQPSEIYLYYDYLVGSLEIKQQKDARGKDLPSNLAVNYVVSFTGSGNIKNYNGRLISTADKKYSTVFAYDSNSSTYVAQLHMSIMGADTAKIDFIPADTEYNIEVEDNDYYLLTALEGQSGKIEKEKDKEHLTIYSYHGSEENAVATVRYDGKKIIATPTPTPTPTPTATSTATPTITATPTATNKPAATPTATNKPATTPTATNKSTTTPTATNIPAVDPTAINTPAADSTATNVPIDTPMATKEPATTPTVTKVPAEDPTVTPSSTEIPTSAIPGQESGYLKKNTVIKNKKGIFVVTGKGKVAYKNPLNKKVKSVSIPKSIKYKGKEYKVTEISADAFKSCKKLKKVTISSNIKKIGKQAFYGCEKLKIIKIKTTKLKKNSIGKKAFSKIHKKPVFKCPKKKLKIYKKILNKSGVSQTSKYK